MPPSTPSKLKSLLPKAIFWTFSIFLTIILAQNITARPEQTLQTATLLILIALIYKRPQIGLYIIIFLPVVGELLRYPPGSEGGVLLSDIFIPIFLMVWLAKNFFETNARSPKFDADIQAKPQRRAAPLRLTPPIQNLPIKYHLPQITLPLTLFILAAALSLVQSLLYLSPQEVASGSLYLIRFIQYILLFFATHQLITSNPLTLKARSSFKVNQITQTPPVSKAARQKTTLKVVFWKNLHPKNTFKVFFPNQPASPSPKTIITLLTISTLLLAIAGFIQLAVFPDLASLEEEGWDPHINRLVSTWLDPNFVGGLFAFMISILLGITLHLKKISQKIGLLSIITILAIALFLTYSRSAYLAAATGLIIVSLLKSRKILIIALILFLIGITVSDRARERTQELATSATSIIFQTAENPDPTARLRLKSWQQTFELFQKRPLLGSGYNTLRYVNHYEGYVVNPQIHSAGGSDSSLLTILATTGILGFIPFLTIYIILIITAFKNWRAGSNANKPYSGVRAHAITPIHVDTNFNPQAPTTKNHLPEYLKGYNLGFLGGIFALLIHSIFVNSLLFPQIMIFFYIAAALTPEVRQSKNIT